MTIRLTPCRFTGTIKVPPSKSHTIRQLLIASLADGVSQIINPLDSLDTRSCIKVCKAFGAEITEERREKREERKEGREEIVCWTVKGNNNFKNPSTPLQKPLQIDVSNSGTTLFLALAIAGLQSEWVEFTGDEQIQKRSAAPLLEALTGLGVQSQSNNGCTPIKIKGPWKSGKVILPCPTSQYLSALLIASPLAPAGVITEIEVPLLNEKPYVDMTLSYLKTQKASVTHHLHHFIVHGGAEYKPFNSSVPADFSSAAFPAAAAAITGGPATLIGLDPQDTQGDKRFFEILEKMGCNVQWRLTKKVTVHNTEVTDTNSVTVSRDKPLCTGSFDLNDTPDLLPAAAVVAAFAEGDTTLANVAHARIKETDRIAVMVKELAKLGVCCTELPDGLVIHGKGGLFKSGFSPPDTVVIDGHGDHRIVMAFAAAALGCPVPVEITTAESVDVTYPGFWGNTIV